MALDKIRIPRYKHIKAILAAEKDIEYRKAKDDAASASSDNTLGYIRGADYYGGDR
jgi:hypothetical protein